MIPKTGLIAVFILTAASLGALSPEAGPVYNPFIMGWGSLTVDQMAGYLLSVHKEYPPEQARELAGLYVEEAQREGVNHDLAFTQMLLETGFQRYGGQVSRHQNNFAGLGALDGGDPGLSFPDRRTGVRAHIQHLKAYGSRQPLNQDLVNPRFGFVVRESAPTVYELARRWASDPAYGVKIMTLLERIHGFRGTVPTLPTESGDVKLE